MVATNVDDDDDDDTDDQVRHARRMRREIHAQMLYIADRYPYPFVLCKVQSSFQEIHLIFVADLQRSGWTDVSMCCRPGYGGVE